MRTDRLIQALAIDHRIRADSFERRLAILLVPALVLAAAVFMLGLGPRKDLAIVATDLRILLKFVVTLALASAATVLVCRLARPGCATKVPMIALAAGPALLAIATLVELATVPSSAWAAKVTGTGLLVCLVSIPLLSLPILIAILIALRHGAPTRPVFAGAVAGLLAGGLGTALYAAYCPNDSALFGATWYTITIAGIAILGSIAGRRLLRW